MSNLTKPFILCSLENVTKAKSKQRSDIPWDPSALCPYEGLGLFVLDFPMKPETEKRRMYRENILLFNRNTGMVHFGVDAALLSAFAHETTFVRDRESHIAYTGSSLPPGGAYPKQESKKYFDRQLSAAKKAYDADTVSLILDGRMKVVLLLRTPGGHETPTGITAAAATYWKRKNSGKVFSIGMEEVSSAGAVLFLLADPPDRLTLPDAQFMWHCPVGAGGGVLKHTSARLLTKQKQELHQLFSYEADQLSGKKRTALLRKVHRALRMESPPDHKIVCDGQDLLELGMVKDLAQTPDNLMYSFSRETGIEVNFEDYLHNPSSRYFLISSLQRAARERFKLRVSELAIYCSPEKHRNTQFNPLQLYSLVPDHMSGALEKRITYARTAVIHVLNLIQSRQHT